MGRNCSIVQATCDSENNLNLISFSFRICTAKKYSVSFRSSNNWYQYTSNDDISKLFPVSDFISRIHCQILFPYFYKPVYSIDLISFLSLSLGWVNFFLKYCFSLFLSNFLPYLLAFILLRRWLLLTWGHQIFPKFYFTHNFFFHSWDIDKTSFGPQFLFYGGFILLYFL